SLEDIRAGYARIGHNTRIVFAERMIFPRKKQILHAGKQQIRTTLRSRRREQQFNQIVVPRTRKREQRIERRCAACLVRETDKTSGDSLAFVDSSHQRLLTRSRILERMLSGFPAFKRSK